MDLLSLHDGVTTRIMLLIETLVVFRSLPFALMVAGLILFGVASIGIPRRPEAPSTPNPLAHITVFAPFFASAVAFLHEVGRSEPELIGLAAAIGHGAAALFWSGIVAGATFVGATSLRGGAGTFAPLYKGLAIVSASLISISFAWTAWTARPWFAEIPLASWVLLLAVSWWAVHVRSSGSFRSHNGVAATPIADLAAGPLMVLVVGWIATAWGLLARASRTPVITDPEIVVIASSAVTITFLWSGAFLIILTATRVLRRDATGGGVPFRPGASQS